MVIRINTAKTGVMEYLKTGRRSDCPYLREEKDLVIPVGGDRDLVKKTIKLSNKIKPSWKHHYFHVTVGFTDEEYQKLQETGVRKLTEELIKLLLNGYSKKEYVYYAEIHYPKMKVINGKERYPHVHIVIPSINLKTLKKIVLTGDFLKKKQNAKLIDAYLTAKYNLTPSIEEKKRPLKELEEEVRLMLKRKKERKEIKKTVKNKRSEKTKKFRL